MSPRRATDNERGLATLNDSRQARRRAIVLGKSRISGTSPQFWVWTVVLIAGFGVIYWQLAEREVASEKARVMAKQRAVAKTLGPKILPFQEKVEGWARRLAGEYPGDFVKAGFEFDTVSRAPGVYFRLRAVNAADDERLRSAAAQSLHDGFTACFFVNKTGGDPKSGPPCRAIADCESGLLCNEYDVCAKPSMPFNMRLLYRALKILSSKWTDELHQAPSELALRGYERDLQRVTHDDVPIAIDLLSRAKYFTVVLDEDPKGGLPPPLEREKDSDLPAETDEERVQRVDHWARIGVWEIESGKAMFRARIQAGGRVVPVGQKRIVDPHNQAAQQRQANSCALALAVKSKLAPAPKHDPADAGAADAGSGDAGAPKPQKAP